MNNEEFKTEMKKIWLKFRRDLVGYPAWYLILFFVVILAYNVLNWVYGYNNWSIFEFIFGSNQLP